MYFLFSYLRITITKRVSQKLHSSFELFRISLTCVLSFFFQVYFKEKLCIKMKFPLNSFSAFLYHNNTEHNICFVIEYKIDPIRDWSDNNSPYHHTIFYFNDIDVNIPRQYHIIWLYCFKLKLGTGMKSYRNFRMNLNMLIKISKKKWTEKLMER